MPTHPHEHGGDSPTPTLYDACGDYVATVRDASKSMNDHLTCVCDAVSAARRPWGPDVGARTRVTDRGGDDEFLI